MNILQINSVCGTGSTGRIAAELYAYLKDKGDTGAVAYGRGEAKDCDSTIRIGSKRDIYRHAAKARILDRTGFGSKSATSRFIKQIEEMNPDILHLHNIHGYYLHIGELFSYLKQAGKPVIWTLHDCWPFTGHCAYFEYYHCDRWKTGCHSCPQKSTYPKRLWIDSSINNYQDKKKLFTGLDNLTIVTPSAWLAEQVKQSFLSPYPVQVIPNGIDLDIFKPTAGSIRAQYGIHEYEFVLIAVAGIWEERKGLPVLLELSRRLGTGFRFILVGVTDKQKERLPKNCIGITRTENTDELAALYSAADVYVNTTLDDNFPTTNLESLACGTPVITFDTGGSTESVDDLTGLIVPKGNIDALEQAVKKVQLQSKMYYSDNCIQRACEKYDKRKSFAAYWNLYHTVSPSN